MSNSKKMLSLLIAVVIIIMSVISPTAIIAPEDSISAEVQWIYKIDDALVEKMSKVSDTDLIPVWVWMTDIDMEQLDKDIEARTGISQQKLDIARAEIGYDVSTMSTNVENLNSTDAHVQNAVSTYLEATKAQREKIANDTEVYLATKKAFASQRYTTENTTKIRQIGVSNDRIDFQSELTPSFVAYLTKDEIIETAKSSNVVEMGYFSEYDEANPVEEPTQTEVLEVEEDLPLESTEEPIEEQTEAPTELPTLDVSTLHTGIKQAIQHDLALEKYDVTGNGVKVLHIDSDYIRSDKDNSHLIPNSNNIYNLINGETYEITDVDNIPLLSLPDENGKNGSHANFCVSYLQAFAENVIIYSVPNLNEYTKLQQYNINPLNDVEHAIIYLDVDLISSSSSEGRLVYESNFSAKWYDAIVSMYNVPVIASAGNGRTVYQYPIAPANGYNSIAVGVYYSRNNSMVDDYVYTTSTTDQTRVTYKPDLVVAMDSYADKFGATSAGAPTVAAIVAMMMELEPMLVGQPEVIKAILMASCHEKAQRSQADITAGVAQELMTDGLTPKQGAGKVNVLRALNIVKYGTYGYGNINQTQNFTTAKRFSINSQVFGDATLGPSMNVSVAWLRSNTKASNINDDHDSITLGAYCDLDLKIQYTEDGVSKEKSSTVDNASKQLVYFPTTELDTQYSLKIYWGDNSTNNVTKKYGYAYSIGAFDKVLDKVEVNGITGVGRTLTASAYTADTLPVQDGTVTYRWHKSDDGESWQLISGETSSTYEITDTVLNKYIRCVVTQNYLNNYRIINVLSDKVVLYGDVDNDGVVSILDVSLINSYLANYVVLTDSQMLVADVDLDDVVSVMDVTLIQNYINEQIPYLPYEGDL